ncbi:MAG TPA: preprotein translocase subunit SecY [bacterium]|nr:preprotein translocase subunit SecY [bacterium]
MSNPLADSLAIPELKKRLLVTLGLLLVYRIGCQVPTPGVNPAAMQALMSGQQGGVLGVLNLFTGGALGQFSVFALGIMPYISCSIIMQLLTEVMPQLKQLKNEGEAGHRKITQYTRYGTVALALFQSFMMTKVLRAMAASAPASADLILHDTALWTLMAAMTLTTGTLFVMWLGEQITEFGIGNGMSLIIFVGIVSRLPREFYSVYQAYDAGNVSPFGIIFFLLVMLALIALTVVSQLAYRKVAVQYAQRQMGRRLMGGGSTVLPLKVDYSGVIAVIFASSLLVFPVQIVSYLKTTAWLGKQQGLADFYDTAERWLSHGHPFYVLLYASLTIFFCFFYTAMVFNTDDVAENMKKYGGFIPGLRPGKATADYLARILDRITLGGAILIVVIAVVPDILARSMGIGWYFGGTTFLIVVGVALDTMRQVESHLLMRHYDGFMKDQKVRGRFG